MIRGLRMVAVVLTATIVAGTALPAHAALIGPIQPYLSFADSPFAPLVPSFSYFHLETYEEPGAPANSPGVTMTAPGGVSVLGPGPTIDSVDGGGNNGHSLFSGCGSCGIKFSFDSGVLGALPTHAGIVWTDGLINIHFQAFDQNGNSLGMITDSNPGDFSNGDGNPQHFRFYGASNPGGISAIFISNDGGGIEVDHLQYGLLSTSVPEPTSLALLSSGLAGLTGIAWRRRRK
jgi:PEP-CTERM motif-containing protein